jgi:hypothetical protein
MAPSIVSTAQGESNPTTATVLCAIRGDLARVVLTLETFPTTVHALSDAERAAIIADVTAIRDELERNQPGPLARRVRQALGVYAA